MSPEKRPAGGDSGLPDSAAEFLIRYEERLANRPPDGAFAEHQDQVAYSIIEQVMPLALDAAPGAVESTVETIPWGTPQADRQIAAQVTNASGIFNRALLACLDEPAAEQSSRTFSWLAARVQEFPADTPRRPPEEQRIWRQKLDIFGLAYLGITQKTFFEQRAYGQATTTPEAQSVVDALESHLAQIRESILSLDASDTSAIMHLLDAELASMENVHAFIRTSGAKPKFLRKGRHIPEGLYEVMREAGSKASTEWHMSQMYLALSDPLETKWKACEALCSWQQVNEILTVLPGLQSTEMRVRAADALSDMSEVQLAGSLAADDFPAESLAELIHYDIYNNVPPSVMPVALSIERSDMTAEVSYMDITLPREMAPAASVALLGDIAERNTAEEFEAILLRAQETICGKPSRTNTNLNEWLLTLALLRKSGGSVVRERTDAFIARDDFPHGPFKGVVTNQRAGRIYLLPNGKIRVADNLSNAYCLETSSASAPEEQKGQPAAKRTPVELTGGHQNVTREKGVQVAPGKQTTKRRKREAARKSGPAGPETTNEPAEQLRPTIILGPGETLKSIGDQISSTDLAIVAQAIADNQTYGSHPMVPLRARSPRGNMLCKLRVNGVGSGIRVIMEHVGRNQFQVQTIQYRGGAYKNLPR
jgi:hypothetical protein